MEDQREIEEQRRFRWTARPSEEELLGVPGHASRRATAGFRASPLPLSAGAQAEGVPTGVLHRRLRARDLVALTAVCAAVWFVFRGAEGVPSPNWTDTAPVQADKVVGGATAFDRAERLWRLSVSHRAQASPPRLRSAKARTTGTTPTADGVAQAAQGSKRDPTPPSSGDNSNPPLVEATIPGVGTVTVDQPDLPLPVETPTIESPDLSDRVGLLPVTTTASLP